MKELTEEEIQLRKAKSEYARQWRLKHPNYNKEWVEKHPMERAALNRIHSHNQSDKAYGRGKGDLTVEWYIANILSKSCIHCGESDWHKIGCNRIDNSKPHTMDNVEPCCKRCNSILGNKSSKSKRIDQISPIDGEVIASFFGAREVARQLGYKQSNISACARGEKRIAYGYIWKYPL